jgi:hypothetical protein
MRRSEALQGVRMGGFFESSPPLGIGRAEPGEGGGRAPRAIAGRAWLNPESVALPDSDPMN